MSVITLRSGKQVDGLAPHSESKTIDGLIKQPSSSSSTKQKGKDDEVVQKRPLPFPHRVTQSKKAKIDKEIMETFRKVEVNIPLLEAIKQIPKYAKFLKELCTHKRRLRGNEKISVGCSVSALIQPTMPPKYKDSGTSTIPCTIGNMEFTKLDARHSSLHQRDA